MTLMGINIMAVAIPTKQDVPKKLQKMYIPTTNRMEEPQTSLIMQIILNTLSE